MLQIGAGTGLIYILRWFWWRINPWTEISAMTVSFLVAFGFFLLGKNPGWVSEGHWILQSHWQLCLGIAITTVCWLIVTFATAPVDDATLRNFVRKTRPGGPGWTRIENQIVAEGGHRVKPRLAMKILCIFLGCFTVWGSLFCIGAILYGKMGQAGIYGGIAAISLFLIFRIWDSISGDDR
jgi:hypothetical protein